MPQVIRFAVVLAVFAILCAVPTSAQPATVPLDILRDVSIWRDHKDGGAPVIRTQVDGPAPNVPAIKLVYKNREPGWGNSEAPCSIVPPNASALRFRIFVHSAVPQAAMHLWLLEPDGDCWMQQILVGSTPIGQTKPGWREITLPVARFSFEPRGPGSRSMTSVDRMLLGCNYGDLEVSVSDMAWITQSSAENVPLPRSQSKPMSGGRGAVAVLDMAPFPDGMQAGHKPAALAAALRAEGYGVSIVRAGDIADPAYLTPARFDAVILPCGNLFPVAARETFLKYLRAGGSFLSTDGYAFDRLVAWNGTAWVDAGSNTTAATMASPSTNTGAMNTRTGKSGDAMTFVPEQIGVFDPAFLVRNAVAMRIAPLYAAGGRSSRLPVSRPISGYAACGLTGLNNPVFPPVYRRWIPVIETIDKQGRARGAALAVMHNFAGEYHGSSWAFSGLTNAEDLLTATPARQRLLARVVDEITTHVFLHGLTSNYASYRLGERATVSVQVSNLGTRAKALTVMLSVNGKRIGMTPAKLAPGETRTIKATIPVTATLPDLTRIRAELRRDGALTDAMDSAFCVWNERIVQNGPRIAWKDNYLTVDGHPTFLVGANQTGMMFYSESESPAVWDRDFRNMATSNVHILRILHFSPYAKDGYAGLSGHGSMDLSNRPERLRRQMDAIVQIAMKHRVAIFLAPHDWIGLGDTDEELAAQADWNRFWADRYSVAPGMIFDIQNEPAVDVPDRPDIVALWNGWLGQRYGTDDALHAAWTVHPPEQAMPNVPLNAPSGAWDDTRAADRKRFEAEILNRWVKANVDGIRAGNPHAPICVGYLPFMAAADRVLGTRYTDFSNMHYYGPISGLPFETKMIDRRAYGKGLSLGEFGAQEAHDARNRGETGMPIDASVKRYRQTVHYGLGLGGAFVQAWCWKDFDEMVFPWGLVHHNSQTPKPWLYHYGMSALLASFLEPVYRQPQVYLLLPDHNRIGPRFDEMHAAIRESIRLLLDVGVDFSVLNEEDLATIPAGARAIVWPLPYCPDDAVFDKVHEWVSGGGALYFSGGIGFDTTRHPTRATRYAALGLPSGPMNSPFAAPENAWKQQPLEGAVGTGKVLMVPYPLELRTGPDAETIYERFLHIAGVSPYNAHTNAGTIHTMVTHTSNGGRIVTLVRTDTADGLATVTLPGTDVAIELGPQGSAFVCFDAHSRLVAVETDRRITISGKLLAAGTAPFGLIALDSVDLRTSREAAVLAPDGGTFDLHRITGLTGASQWAGALAGPWLPNGHVGPQVTLAEGQVAIVAAHNRIAHARIRLLSRIQLRAAR